MSKKDKPNFAKDVRDNRAKRDREQAERLREQAERVKRDAEKKGGKK